MCFWRFCTLGVLSFQVVFSFSGSTQSKQPILVPPHESFPVEGSKYSASCTSFGDEKFMITRIVDRNDIEVINSTDGRRTYTKEYFGK